MLKVKVEGYIIVPDFDLKSVQEELPKHSRLTREEEGCLVFDVSQDRDNINRFYVYEEFVNRRAFELHQQRVGQSTWGRVSANVERHYNVSDME